MCVCVLLILYTVHVDIHNQIMCPRRPDQTQSLRLDPLDFGQD